MSFVTYVTRLTMYYSKRFSCHQFGLICKLKFGAVFSMLCSEHFLPLPTGELVKISKANLQKTVDIVRSDSPIAASMYSVSAKEASMDRVVINESYFQFKIKGHIVQTKPVIDIILSILEEAANDVIATVKRMVVWPLNKIGKTTDEAKLNTLIRGLIQERLCSCGINEKYFDIMENIVCSERSPQVATFMKKVLNVLRMKIGNCDMRNIEKEQRRFMASSIFFSFLYSGSPAQYSLPLSTGEDVKFTREDVEKYILSPQVDIKFYDSNKQTLDNPKVDLQFHDSNEQPLDKKLVINIFCCIFKEAVNDVIVNKDRMPLWLLDRATALRHLIDDMIIAQLRCYGIEKKYCNYIKYIVMQRLPEYREMLNSVLNEFTELKRKSPKFNKEDEKKHCPFI